MGLNNPANLFNPYSGVGIGGIRRIHGLRPWLLKFDTCGVGWGGIHLVHPVYPVHQITVARRLRYKRRDAGSP